MKPTLTKDLLVDLAGWDLVKEGRSVAEGGSVRDPVWEGNVLSGKVMGRGNIFWPRLNFVSESIAESQCSCMSGRQGRICVHSAALVWHCILKEKERAATELAEAAATPAVVVTGQAFEQARKGGGAPPAVTLQNIVISSKRGLDLNVRLLLPPNLAAAAERDTIIVGVELEVQSRRVMADQIDRGRAYAPTDHAIRVIALLEAWNKGKLMSWLQLTRGKLKTLLEAVRPEPCVFWGREEEEPIAWGPDGTLAGVHENLEPKPEAAPAPVPAPSPVRAAPARSGFVHRASGVARDEGVISEGMEVDGSTEYVSVKLPPRGSLMYDEALELLKNNGFQLDARLRMWFLRDRHKTLNFLARHGEELRERFGARLAEGFLKRIAHVTPVRVEARAEQATGSASGGWNVDIKVHAGGCDAQMIRAALASNRHYVEADGRIYLLEPEQLEKITKAQQALTGDATTAFSPEMRVRLDAARLADAEDLLEDITPEFRPPETWQQRSAALRHAGKLSPAPMDPALDDLLRGYQRLGVAWMWHLYRNDLGGVLADEMGLGKTVQALAFLTCLRRQAGSDGPSLVVCPASLVENWRRETVRFAPSLKLFAHHGRRRLTEEAHFEEFDIVLTSYGTLTRDAELFAGVKFNGVIADEAQHLKNRRSQNAKALRSLPARGRFVLTGTPVENSLDDARSLFDFLLPGYLSRVPGGMKGEDRAWFDDRHRKQIAPYILRRTKQLVAPELPAKIEQVVFCEMGTKQRAVYKGLHEKTEKAIFELEMAGASDQRIRFAALTQLLRLRQACADPGVIDPAYPLAESAKFEAFMEILDEAVDGNHRVLVFSSFVSVLQRLRDGLAERSVNCCYLDGSTANRQGEVDRFQNDAGIPVFLISLKAGGVGLNLTGADTVVHFDPWWNPAAEAQATDRAHRIGQTRTVTSLKLIAAGTIEERVLALQKTKDKLLQELLEESEAANAKVSLDDIKEMLGAVGEG